MFMLPLGRLLLFDRQQAEGSWVMFIAQISAVGLVAVGIPKRVLLELLQCVYLVIPELKVGNSSSLIMHKHLKCFLGGFW